MFKDEAVGPSLGIFRDIGIMLDFLKCDVVFEEQGRPFFGRPGHKCLFQNLIHLQAVFHGFQFGLEAFILRQLRTAENLFAQDGPIPGIVQDGQE